MAKESMIPEEGFSEHEQIEAWLRCLGKPQTNVFSRAIVVRIASRCLPNFGSWLLPEHEKGNWKTSSIVASLRCIVVAQAAALNSIGKLDIKFTHAASSAARSVTFGGFAHHDLSGSGSSVAQFNVAFSTARSAARIAAGVTGSVGVAASVAAQFYGQSEFSSPWAAITADARALEAGLAPAEIAARALWPENSSIIPQFDRKTFLAAAPSFEVWLDWYEPIVEGKAPWGLPRDIATKLEERIALGDDRGEGGKDFWQRDADEVNAEIKGWVEQEKSKLAAARAKTQVPKANPASVRAVWNGEFLEGNPQLNTDLAEAQFQALLAAFKAELSVLIREASNNRHSNSVSADAILMLKATRKLIPVAWPNSTCLFRLAVKQEMMLEYATVVRSEWPNLLGAQYRALTVQLGMLVDQTPEVRKFKQNAANAELDAILGNEAANAARAVSSELGKKSAKKFVDKSVTTGLNNVADQVDEIISAMPSTGNLPSAIALKTANYDALESTNNILKELVIKAEKADRFSRVWMNSTRRSTNIIPKHHELLVAKRAETAAKWAGNAVMANSALAILAQRLSLKYPSMFGWFAKTNPPEPFSGTTIDAEINPKKLG